MSINLNKSMNYNVHLAFSLPMMSDSEIPGWVGSASATIN